MISLERIWKWSWPVLKHYSGFDLKELGKITGRAVGKVYSGRDSKRVRLCPKAQHSGVSEQKNLMTLRVPDVGRDRLFENHCMKQMCFYWKTENLITSVSGLRGIGSQ
jgi:hypothetical protein